MHQMTRAQMIMADTTVTTGLSSIRSFPREIFIMWHLSAAAAFFCPSGKVESFARKWLYLSLSLSLSHSLSVSLSLSLCLTLFLSLSHTLSHSLSLSLSLIPSLSLSSFSDSLQKNTRHAALSSVCLERGKVNGFPLGNEHEQGLKCALHLYLSDQDLYLNGELHPDLRFEVLPAQFAKAIDG